MAIQKNFIGKLLLTNSVAFPFLAIIGAVLIALEAITYPGFIQNHLFLDPTTFFALLIISGYFVVVRVDSYKKTRYFELLARLILLFFPALVVVGTIFLSLERSHYKGYVYTHGFHFDPSYFFYLFAISFLIFLVDISTRKGFFGKNRETEIPKMYLSVFILSLFIYMIYGNLIDDAFDAKPRLSAVIKHPFASITWKGRFLFADFYDYMKFVDKYTPQDTTIMRMPQQGKWPSLSNDGYDRSFIYPRFTKAGDETNLNDPSISYVFIHRAYGPPRVDKYIEKWPTFPVKAKEILYMRDNDFTKPPITLFKDYDPNDHTYDDLWGLIILKR